jgi:integrase
MSVYLRKGSPHFWVEFEFKGQRVRRSSGTPSRRKAEEYERLLRREMHEQVVLGNSPAPTTTIREAVERYITTHLKMKKRRAKSAKADVFLLNSLIDRLGGDDVLLSSLTVQVIAGVKDKMIADGLRPASVNKYLAALKAILRKASREWGILLSVPTITLITLDNNRMRWLTADEEKSLLAACEKTPHLRDLVIFLLDTGARLSEGTGLRWQDVDLDRSPRPVVRFMQTKSGKPRSVPLTQRTTELLRRLYLIRPANEPHVFLQRFPGYSWRGTKPKAKPFYNPHGSWKAAVKRAGLADVVLHDLRHTFASRLVQKGVPLLAVSKLLGHASLTMTMRYAHLAPDDLDTAVAALDAPAKPDPNPTQKPPQRAA